MLIVELASEKQQQFDMQEKQQDLQGDPEFPRHFPF
jgi:hypothetical protein